MHANTLLQNLTSSLKTTSGVLLPYEFTLLQNRFTGLSVLLNVLLPYKITLLQNIIDEVHAYDAVLLPYEFTLLQNLKRGLKLLPVYVSQGIQLHFIISFPFCQKNILSAMLVQICSTTLRFCTSSNAQIGI